MLLAHHLILTAYGFWLPNDPRGSWSDFVRSWELLRFGPATKAHTRRSVAAVAHDRELRLAAKESLARKPVIFNGHQALAIAQGFAARTRNSGYRVYACCILPDHVHMVLARHDYRVEKMAELLKGSASDALAKASLHPFQDVFYRNGRRPTPWARGYWKVFLFDETAVARAIRYVEQNPVKEGKRVQKWSFVTPFESASLRDRR